MNDRNTDGAWNIKGGTLSDKSARKEFGLTQSEIIKAINRGDLQYRVNSIHGNPFLRLIRSEVEALIEKRHGGTHLKQKKLQKELVEIDNALRLLERDMARLRKRRTVLVADLDGLTRQHNHRTVNLRRARRK